MRGALALLVLVVAASPVRADEAPAARPLADQLAQAKDKAARTAAVDALTKLDPVPIAELAEILARKRTATDAERRAVLTGRGFEVPDEKGKFRSPGRQTDAEEKKNDKLDWLAPVADLPASPAVADVLVDLAIIRALAASNVTAGAQAILAFAFTADGVAYRDECGRFLRRMSPWSLPALILAAETKQKTEAGKSAARYAKYQLERLDRENPRKALNDAPTDALKIEVLKAFADSQYREAVYAVLDAVDHVSPAVRQAARDAWMEYATGRPPPPPPKEKLALPGGKLTEEEMPLWLDHRELADIAIRRRLEQLTGAAPDKATKLGDLSKQLFDFHDKRRAETLDKVLDDALAKGGGADLAGAAADFDRILVQAPNYARRADMADIYLRYGEELEKQGKHREAAATFGKAHSVAPDGPLAGKALAEHHRARGGALEAEGKDGAAEMARASEIADTYGVPVDDGGDRSWMLYAGVGGATLGLLLLVWGIASRRRRHYR